jgi:hypothetical protein
MINLVPLCNAQPLLAALECHSYEKLEEQYFRELCRRPGLAWGANASSTVRGLSVISANLF